ncbi:MAG TPA: GTPase ObgE [Deltaproteobacteria bacterium]|nr:GTPase ObgE [Deltaproteobacteria bacterium]
MVFVDEAVITARSGDGGKGCVSFRRERFVPKGGPDGGNGGDGGSVIIRATERLYTLRDFTRQRHFRAGNGETGRGKSQTGKNGPPCVIETPVGTLVQDDETGDILADLVEDNQEVILITGGRGGRGNQHFATSTNRAPRMAQPGLPGREKRLRLTLKLLAHVGLVGLPNAGKSTLLSSLTMARPKIDAYPFTTTAPNLGIIDYENGETLIMADIPGLVEGASSGRGLGHRFLRHVERTGLLLHLLDITYQPGQDIMEDFLTLRREIEAFTPQLAKKPFLVAINKIDLYGPEHRDLPGLQKALLNWGVPSFPISALTGEGLEELKETILQKWKETQRRWVRKGSEKSS